MPLHPVIAAMLAKAREAGRPGLSEGTPEEGRALMAAGRVPYGRGPDIGVVETVRIPTRGGGISARLFHPEAAPLGFVVYVHGGGWALGAPDDFDHVARALVARSGCSVLLPDYRLAPEHPFPAALEDTEDAIRWAARHGTGPLVVAGDSAGANLALVAALALRSEVTPVFQALIYPVADCDMTRPSYRDHGSGLVLAAQDMAWFLDLYAPATLHADPRISPLRAADVTGLPPTLVLTAEYDVLRDEGEALARHLAAAGVAVTLRRIDGLPHGFVRMFNLVETASAALTEVAEAIRAYVKAKPV